MKSSQGCPCGGRSAGDMRRIMELFRLTSARIHGNTLREPNQLLERAAQCCAHTHTHTHTQTPSLAMTKEGLNVLGMGEAGPEREGVSLSLLLSQITKGHVVTPSPHQRRSLGVVVFWGRNYATLLLNRFWCFDHKCLSRFRIQD